MHIAWAQSVPRSLHVCLVKRDTRCRLTMRAVTKPAFVPTHLPMHTQHLQAALQGALACGQVGE